MKVSTGERIAQRQAIATVNRAICRVRHKQIQGCWCKGDRLKCVADGNFAAEGAAVVAALDKTGFLK